MSPQAKSKYAAFMEKKQQNTGQPAANSSNKYLNYYNPNKELNEKGTCFCRVLPNKNAGDMFFYEGKKHRFKVGMTSKMAFCLYSINPKTEDRIADSCPFCDFLESNHESLSDDTIKALSAKEFSTMLVYNYMKDEIQKYEVNYYGLNDIMPLISKLLDNNVDIDTEGFDLIFKKDKSGYAKAVDATEPKISLKEVFNNSNRVKEIPDLYSEVIPTVSDKFKQSINVTFQYALKAFAPTFADSAFGENNESHYHHENTMANDGIPNAMYESPNTTDVENNVEEVKPKMSKSVIADNSEDDAMLEDLQEFVSAIKNKQN